MLKKKIVNAEFRQPSLDSMKRFNLVGLTFEMNKDEVVQSIIDENNSWLNLEKVSNDTVRIRNDPYAILIVHNVVKCRNNDIYRAVISMSKRFLASIGNQKLSIGFSKCHMYEIKSHRRCNKCQRIGHLAKDCQNEIACSRCSLGHAASSCHSHSFKCVNCSIHSKENSDHPSYFSLCPYNAP